MDRTIQQRLLGAAILLAVLVIVVPELLDGAGHRSRYPSQIDLPDVPEFTPMPEVDALPVTQPDIPAQPVPDVTEELPVAAASVEPPPIEVVAQAADKPDVQKAPPPVTKPAATNQKSAVPVKPVWALQIGSFSDKKNALKLRDVYRKKGFAAYVDEEKGTYRVRIGPELDRQRIEKLQDRIFRQEKVKGMIVNK